MAETNLIVELVNQCDIYSKESDSPTMIGFCLWYFNKANSQVVSNTATLDAEDASLKIGDLLHRLNKFYEFYVKKSIEETGLSNVEDFVFLSSLYSNRDSSKGNLIEKNVMEPPSGFDVIKRLEAVNLADSIPAKNDKRAKLLRLTAKGSKILKKNEVSIQKASDLFSKPINEEQKSILIETLSRLDNFHTLHYSTRLRELPIADIELKLNEPISILSEGGE